jgi:hypothetical protein
MTKTVICMKWGKRYPADFANRLYSMVRRNVTGDLRFVCFTDDKEGLLPDVEYQPLPPIDLPEKFMWYPWRKISLWQPGLGGLEGEVLFLDVDLIVTGSLDPFFEYHPGKMCIAENWTQIGEGIGNTSVYKWTIGEHTEIFEKYQRDNTPIHAQFRASQQYVSAMIPDKIYWPSEWCVSFKHSLMPKFPLNWFQTPRLPEETRIVAFTGRPDPDEARDGRWQAPWYKRIYKHVKPTPWIAEHWR